MVGVNPAWVLAPDARLVNALQRGVPITWLIGVMVSTAACQAVSGGSISPMGRLSGKESRLDVGITVLPYRPQTEHGQA